MKLKIRFAVRLTSISTWYIFYVHWFGVYMVRLVCNPAMNGSTKSSLHNLIFAHTCNNTLTNLWNVNDIISQKLTPEQMRENLENPPNNVRRSMAQNQRRKRYQFPRRNHPFKVNMEIYVKTHDLSKAMNKFCKKLAPRYVGPYVIGYLLSNSSVLVQYPANLEDEKNEYAVDFKKRYSVVAVEITEINHSFFEAKISTQCSTVKVRSTE